MQGQGLAHRLPCHLRAGGLQRYPEVTVERDSRGVGEQNRIP